MGILIFSLNITLDGCVDHQEGIADDETHAFFTRLMDAGEQCRGSHHRRTTEVLSQHDSNAEPCEFVHEVCRRLALKHDTVRHADGADLAARGSIDLFV